MKKPITIKPRQLNHDAYHLPEVIQNTTEKKLYMNVARWAMEQKKAISSQCVAKNFGLTSRQATNIISMLHLRYDDIITSVITKKKEGRVTRTFIRVLNIEMKSHGNIQSKQSICINKGTSIEVQEQMKKIFFFGSLKKNKLS